MGKRTIDPDTIDLLGGRAQANRLEKYAMQAGTDAIPLLQRAFAEGSATIRLAAVEALGSVAPSEGERLVLTAAQELGPKPSKKALRPLLYAACAVGTDACLEKVATWARGGLGSPRLGLPAIVRVANWLVAHVESLDPEFADALIALTRDAMLNGTGPDTNAYVWMLHDTGRMDEAAEHKLLRLGLAGDERALESLRAAGRSQTAPLGAHLSALMHGSPAQVYDELVGKYRTSSEWRRAIVRRLDAGADPRFIDEALAIQNSDTDMAVQTLAAIGTPEAKRVLLRWAESFPTLSPTAEQVLHGIGLAKAGEGAALLMRWLETPEGQRVEPMLLNALASAGNPSVLPALTDLQRRRGGQHWAFFDYTIRTLTSLTERG
jgi:hypothetical protein